MQGCSVLLLVGLTILLTSVIWVPYFINHPNPTFEPSPSMEAAFINKFVRDADANKGITLHVSSFYDSPTRTQSGELLSFDVYNHTNEPVIFDDIGFGIRFFTPDKNLDDWSEVELMIKPDKAKTIVDPATVSDTTAYDNSVSIYYSYFEVNVPKELRVYIIGVGQTSNKFYVAYEDLQR